jgi:hypothetical protein
MRIRYANGRELEADIAQQERTWRNMQLDENAPAPAAPASTRSASSRAPARARVGQRGRDFRGLQDHDFQRGTAGTTWRRKESLGGLLAEMMSQATSHDCQHYAIFRRSELHVAQPERYTVDNKPSQAKFVFELSEQEAMYGFYVERAACAMDGTWHWARFLSALREQEPLQRALHMAMCQLQLRWDVIHDADDVIACVEAAPEGLLWRAGAAEAESLSWPQFAAKLDALDPQKYYSLYLSAHLDKAEAIAAGEGLADHVVVVYRALLPLYEASTR